MIYVHSIQSVVVSAQADIMEELGGRVSIMQQIVKRSVRSSSGPVASQCRCPQGSVCTPDHMQKLEDAIIEQACYIRAQREYIGCFGKE